MVGAKVGDNPLYIRKEFLFGWAGFTLVVIRAGDKRNTAYF